MLKKLRFRLTLLCAVITGLILIGMALAALSISEGQIRRADQEAFQGSLATVVNKLQSDGNVSQRWLAQTEAAGGLVIHIEDAGQPLSFSGSWRPKTDRSTLITAAQEGAQQRGLDCKLPPVSRLEPGVRTFPLNGDHGERYLAAVRMVAADRGWQSLTLLKDMSGEDTQIFRQRLLFLLMAVAGIVLLFAAAWWLAGKAIRPVEESSRRQVEFVAAASHELRSPLAVIRASADAALESPEENSRFLDSITQECGRMARLVDDLLLLAGSDAKTWSIREERLELDTLLIETVELFFPLAHKNNQNLTLDLPDEELPLINGDGQRIRQALSVLIDNALNYTPSGGRVIVRAIHLHRLCVEVEDNGPGIPEEHAAHIFERFYRADKSRNDKQHFGLGLSIAQELARLHRGQLFLKHTGPEGSVFVLELPTVKKEV